MSSKGLIASISNELGQFMVKDIADTPQVVAVVIVVGMWKRLTASILMGGIATSV